MLRGFAKRRGFFCLTVGFFTLVLMETMIVSHAYAEDLSVDAITPESASGAIGEEDHLDVIVNDDAINADPRDVENGPLKNDAFGFDDIEATSNDESDVLSDSAISGPAASSTPEDADRVAPSPVLEAITDAPSSVKAGSESSSSASQPVKAGLVEVTDIKGDAKSTASQPVKAGLVKENGGTYYYKNGKKFTGEIYLGGSWYYFDPEDGGKMSTGFVYMDDKNARGGKKWVYYDANGVMQHGERFINGNWYYLDPYLGSVTYDFVFLKDKFADGGSKWVYYGPYMGDGCMDYGESYIGGGWYYFIPGTGEVDYGWSYIPTGKKWVYYGPYMGDGRMRYGEQRIEGSWYYFNRVTGRVMSSGEIVNMVIDAARQEVGTPDSQTEKYRSAVAALGGNYCDVGPCLSFVWYCFYAAGVPHFFMNGISTGWPHECHDWYAVRGRTDYNPTPGSIAFWQYGGWSSGLSCGHAELVIGNSGGIVYAIGAATGGVQVRGYNIAGILDFAHPYF